MITKHPSKIYKNQFKVGNYYIHKLNQNPKIKSINQITQYQTEYIYPIDDIKTAMKKSNYIKLWDITTL